jgi:hypothetical protein
MFGAIRTLMRFFNVWIVEELLLLPGRLRRRFRGCWAKGVHVNPDSCDDWTTWIRANFNVSSAEFKKVAKGKTTADLDVHSAGFCVHPTRLDMPEGSLRSAVLRNCHWDGVLVKENLHDDAAGGTLIKISELIKKDAPGGSPTERPVTDATDTDARSLRLSALKAAANQAPKAVLLEGQAAQSYVSDHVDMWCVGISILNSCDPARANKLKYAGGDALGRVKKALLDAAAEGKKIGCVRAFVRGFLCCCVQPSSRARARRSIQACNDANVSLCLCNSLTLVARDARTHALTHSRTRARAHCVDQVRTCSARARS